ncbi:transmembrane amino acid transporter protein domain-containing protein [Ditylenchus destructor]|uniref:Transmembrane amino acid transporter protein domain-containing protein n=1 Tax=Ditylenchus destructor TaxID=166010 RepID=A0AAD4NGE1_9BILA|nr:transmembrane amino acid transporter protein domain-containing protein [Ditylenchus destructor]
MALSVPYLIEFMGLIGNITGTVLSFIWPAYFHLRLKGSKLSIQEQRFNKFVIGMGFVICLISELIKRTSGRILFRNGAQKRDDSQSTIPINYQCPHLTFSEEWR